MEFLASVIGIVLFPLFIIHVLQLLSIRLKNLPPGPTPLPIIGNLHLLGDRPHRSMAQLATTQGPIMRLFCSFIDTTQTIVISSAALAKEVLQKQGGGLTFSSRKVTNALHACDHSKYSVLCLPVVASLSKWRSLRKVLSTIIFSKNRLDANEDFRSRRVEELITYCRIKSSGGEPVDIGQAPFTTTLNILSDAIFSKDLRDNLFAEELGETVRDILVEASKPNLVDFFPLLHKIDPQGMRRRMTIHLGKMIKFLDGRLESIIKESTGEIDRTHMEHLCMDLFIVGTDTTSSTIEWAMAEALKNPETMKIAKTELEEIVGKGKIVNEEDILRLPYLQCMVKETLRLHPPVPLMVREAMQDSQIGGYIVPKKSQVVVNIWAIGRDADTWDCPLEFKPERFLESEVDIHGRDFELIPFGAGRRVCPGLGLAMRMVPVMLGSLLNSFEWKLEGGIGPAELDMEEKFGVTLQKVHRLRAVPSPL